MGHLTTFFVEKKKSLQLSFPTHTVILETENPYYFVTGILNGKLLELSDSPPPAAETPFIIETRTIE